MKQKKLFIVVMIFAVIWFGFIFYMSSQTAVNSGQMSKDITKAVVLTGEKVGAVEVGAANSELILKKYNIIIRNTAHVGMYFLLACLVSFALLLWRKSIMKSSLFCFVICILISIIDEINQMHFVGRNSGGVISDGIEDIYRDLFGICVALAIFVLVRVMAELRNKNAHR